MSVDAVTTFFALLAVLGLVFVLVVAVLAVVGRIKGELPASIQPYRDALVDVSLQLGFAVALTCMLGSLYLSEIAHFPPCELCWYQRIAMYPLALLMGVAVLRRDRKVGLYTLPIAAIGFCVSVYHYLLERFPEDVGFSCNTEVPCSTVWVWKFHFLSIPAMAGIGFLLVSTFSILALRSTKESENVNE